MSGIFQHVASVTIPQYLRQEIDATLRNYKMLALLQAKGRISFNNSGTRVEWPVRFRQNSMRPYSDGSGLQFSRQNRHQRAIVDWGAYIMEESISRMDMLQNAGDAALIKLATGKSETIIREMKEQFHTQFYVDGNASGNEDKIDGFETFLGNSGAATNGFIANPNSTYAGLSCTLGTYGGTWSTTSSASDWPRGRGDVNYDFWSPIIVDYGHATGWEISTATWAARCESAIRFGLTHAARNQSKEGMVDGVFLESELWRQYKNLMSGKERIVVNRGDGQSLVSLGFTDVMNQDGAEITSEYGIATGVGYGLNFDDMELMSMNSDLFNFVGPNWSTEHDAHLMFCAFNGQLKFDSPRNQLKFLDL